VQEHLLGSKPEWVQASAHFLENHDEPRIASLLGLEEHRAAALLILSLPGMRLLHEGQLGGARVRVPVQWCSYVTEPVVPGIERMYEELLRALEVTAVGRGAGRILKAREAWQGNPTAQHFVLIQWQAETQGFDLAVINLAAHRSQCYAELSIANLAGKDWVMKDVLGAEEHKYSGQDLAGRGLYLDLPRMGAQLFHFKAQSIS
ncbi:MAG TPA: alpha-amylase, partial [Verrucomicrobiae bacterium]|nr:alpha-amylase [Verrucomicrobiae bacterium]